MSIHSSSRLHWVTSLGQQWWGSFSQHEALGNSNVAKQSAVPNHTCTQTPYRAEERPQSGQRLTCSWRMVSPPLPMMRPTLVPGIDISSTELPSGPPPPPPPPPPPMPSMWGWLPRSMICWISCLHKLQNEGMKAGIRHENVRACNNPHWNRALCQFQSNG